MPSDVGHTLLVFIGTPIVEWSLVMDRSGFRQQVDGVDLGACLLVSGLKLGDMVLAPKGSFHVRKRLGVLQLAPNLVMQKGNLVFCSVVCLEKVSGQGLEKIIGGLFRPFHQVQIVMDVRAVCMDQALGGKACQILWWAFGLDYKALFWSEEFTAAMVSHGPRAIVCQACWAKVMALGAFAWFHVGGPVV